MATIRGRVREVAQPEGGFIDPRLMEVSRYDDERVSPLDLQQETVEPEFVGMAVDYLSRLMTGDYPLDLFIWAIRGAEQLDDPSAADEASELVASLYRGVVDDGAIAAACKLASYIRVFHAGPAAYDPDARTTPDALTTDHIRLMIDRCIPFFRDYRAVLMLEECVFPGGYVGTIASEPSEFVKVAETLWDFDASEHGPTKEHTLQLLAVWLMGLRSGTPQFKTITHLGVFNPRLNAVSRLALADIPAGVIEEVERDVIGSWPDQLTP